jgi:hypothetical protein
MTDSSKFRLEHPIAQRLADLAGVEHDLKLSIRACERFLSGPTVGSEDAILTSRSLATFAIITYCRTISSGVRSGISESCVAALPQRLREAHETFKNIRDKFVAHSVNHFEENSVQIGLDHSGSKVATVGTLHSRTATFSIEQISDLKSLAEALLEMVNSEYDAECDRVWDFLAPMQPAELQSVLITPSDTPRPSKPPHTARKRFR